jgi:phosphoesterase RecJ-like protein
VDVSDVASQFGGGGHVRAAGCRREGDLEQFESDLLDAICRILNGD